MRIQNVASIVEYRNARHGWPEEEVRHPVAGGLSKFCLTRRDWQRRVHRRRSWRPRESVMSENEAVVLPLSVLSPDRAVFYHPAKNLEERVKRARSRSAYVHVMNAGELS